MGCRAFAHFSSHARSIAPVLALSAATSRPGVCPVAAVDSTGPPRRLEPGVCVWQDGFEGFRGAFQDAPVAAFRAVTVHRTTKLAR